MYGADVNYLAVLVAGIAVQPLGFLWYGPLFGRPWRALKGVDPSKPEDASANPGPALAIGFVVALVEFWVLAAVFDWVGVTDLPNALSISALMWLGFVAPIVAMGIVFSDRTSFKLWLIDAGYQLAALLVAGAVIFAFG
jgi:hypothetical protein